MQPRPGTFLARWRSAAAKLLLPALVLAGTWTLYNVPFSLQDGARGVVLALQLVSGPFFTTSLLVVSMALVEAARLRGSSRTVAMIGAAMLSALLSLGVAIMVMTETGIWRAPAFSSPVLLWANFGGAATICVGAVIVEDYRMRSALRNAALRDARLHAADVVRRTTEVRLHAARARVEPRFLFEALSAVERTYEADPAAGNRLLDDLVTYLRAVVPDLRDTAPDADRDAQIASLRRAIERAIGGDREATGGHA